MNVFAISNLKRKHVLFLVGFFIIAIFLFVASGCESRNNSNNNSKQESTDFNGRYIVIDHSFSYNTGNHSEELNGEDIDYSKVYLTINGGEIVFSYYGKDHKGTFDLHVREVNDMYGDQNNAYYDGFVEWDEAVNYLVGGVSDCEYTTLIQDEDDPSIIKLDFSFDYNGTSVYDDYTLKKN